MSEKKWFEKDEFTMQDSPYLDDEQILGLYNAYRHERAKNRRCEVLLSQLTATLLEYKLSEHGASQSPSRGKVDLGSDKLLESGDV